MPAGCCIASCCPLIAPPSCRLIAPAGCCIDSCHPLIALPSHRLVAPAGCRIASRRPLIVPPSCQLVTPACCRCCITSPHPLFVTRAALLSSRCASWLLRHLSTRHPLVVLPSHRAASSCHVAPAGCCAIISCHPLVAPPSRSLIVLAGCCPSNTVEHCCRHGTPPPPPPMNTASIVNRYHSCHPSPPSNANAHI